MKKLLIVLILLFSFQVKAQYFEAFGNGQGLTGGVSPAAYALSGDSANNLLYILGTYKKADGTIFNGSCVWNGNNYDTLFNLFNIPSNEVHTAKWGDTTVITWDESIRLMNGTQLLQVLPQTSDVIEAVCICNNQLYIAGGFATAGGVSVNGIAKWNGTNWEGVGGGLGGSMIGSYIQCLGSYNGDLIAAGHFDLMGGVQANHIARWDGIQWNAMNNGFNNTSGVFNIFSMLEYENKLFISGNNIVDTISSSTRGILFWNGTSWNAPNILVNIQGYKMIIFSGKLFIGGLTIVHDSLGSNIEFSDLTSYNGSNWVYYGCLNISSQTYTIETFQNYIYLGGNFNLVCDSVPANKIVRFSLDSISTLGKEIPLKNKNLLNIYPSINSGNFYLVAHSEKIKNKKLMLSVCDIRGRMVWSEYEQLINGEINKKIELPKEIIDGIYFLKISGSDINETRKMIVQKVKE